MPAVPRVFRHRVPRARTLQPLTPRRGASVLGAVAVALTLTSCSATEGIADACRLAETATEQLTNVLSDAESWQNTGVIPESSLSTIDEASAALTQAQQDIASPAVRTAFEPVAAAGLDLLSELRLTAEAAQDSGQALTSSAPIDAALAGATGVIETAEALTAFCPA